MIAFVRRVWAFVRPYQLRLILGLLCGIFYALANGALLLAVKVVSNLIFAPPGSLSVIQELQNTKALRPWVEHLTRLWPGLNSNSSKLGLGLLIASVPLIMLLRGLLSYLNVYLMSWAAIRAIADIRTRLFDHLQNLSLQFFNRARTGDLISRISNDTWVLYNIIASSFASIIKDPITVVVLLAALLLQQPKLTLISLLVFPVCLFPIVIYGRKVRRSMQAMQTHAAELTSLMHESFTANRIIKAYNLEDTVLGEFKKTSSKLVSQMMRVLRSFEVPSQLTEFLGGVGVALVFLYLLFVPAKPGDMLSFVTGIFLMYQPIKSMSRLHNQLQQARAASERIFEFLDTPNSILDPPKPQQLRAAKADIDFVNIEFGYGDKPVLRNVQLSVKAGQLLALVGSSGSGKTSLTNLLLRFYDPQQGAVLIGDTDIRHVSVKSLRQQIALVAQETILFNDTIRRNIELGCPGATAAQIEEAARNAYAHEFIMEKPDGYDTIVGEKGVALSGGQRQRIAIARALLKDAPILVLDEATNSLDAESERAVQAALERLMIGRTTICIAHRLFTIQKADVIVVLDQGQIIEQGTHGNLIKNGGLYQKLFELQFQ
jgi:subfamily B ATP-binding cassette protein MsbA